MKRWLISLSTAAFLSSASMAAIALPTVAAVEAEVQKGNYAQAQTMMREVVEAKPGSAKAHYIYAEILAHNARFVDAAEQARVAKQIDPAASFTTPDKFREFEQLLAREQQAARPNTSTSTSQNLPLPRPAAPTATAPAERSSGTPGIPIWVWVGAAAIAFIGWRMLSRRAAPAGGLTSGPAAAYGAPGGLATGAPNYGPGQGYAPGAGYGPGMMQQPRAGGGLMGAGLAAAGGVAAGMLAEKYLSGNHGNGNPNQTLNDTGDAGNSFASPDRDQAAQELESRNVDFGSGSDWSDPGSDAGASDGGSGGGSDDW